MSLLAALGITPSGSQNSTESSKPVSLAKMGAIGAIAAYLPGEVLQAGIWQDLETPSFVSLLLGTSIWMGIYAIGYSFSLTVGQNRYLHRPWMSQQEGTIVTLGGAGIGIVSGGVAQFFFTVAVAIGQGNPLFNELARIVAWGLFGGLIGLGMSFIIPNLGRIHGSIGGTVGGAIGAVGFIASGIIAGDAAGRFVGMAVVGAALGYAIGLVEEVSRTAWLQVTHGRSKETFRVSLGKEYVCVGSNSQRCAVWAPEARSIALRFRYQDNQVLCGDMATERSFVADPGFQQQFGDVQLTVCVGASAPPAPKASGPGPDGPPKPKTPRPPAPPPPLPKTHSKNSSTASQTPPAIGDRNRRSPSPPPPPPLPKKQ